MKMRPEQNQKTSAPLCANNCGFYGNPANGNLCSKCYHDFLKSESKTSQNSHSNVASPATLAGKRCPSIPSVVPTALSNGSKTNFDYNRPHTETKPVEENSPRLTTSETTPPSTSPSFPESGPPSERVEPIQKDVTHAPSVSHTPSTSTLNLLLYSSPNDSPPEVGSQNQDSKDEIQTKFFQTDKSRCWKCNRKVGLLGFQCRCGYFYCGQHRYAETHQCNFDYKTYERERIRKQNTKVVADKVARI